jgi:hypothetical protein
MIGELAMGVAVVEESERILESFLVRLPRGARTAETVLADHRSTVSGIAQRHRNRHVLVAQRDVAVPADPAVAGVESRHQGRARWRADRAAGVVVGEADAFASEPIEARRRELGLAVGAEVPISEIVRLNEQEVGPGRSLRILRGRLSECQRSETCDDETRKPSHIGRRYQKRCDTRCRGRQVGSGLRFGARQRAGAINSATSAAARRRR